MRIWNLSMLRIKHGQPDMVTSYVSLLSRQLKAGQGMRPILGQNGKFLSFSF